jgi:hypothetical protein
LKELADRDGCSVEERATQILERHVPRQIQFPQTLLPISLELTRRYSRDTAAARQNSDDFDTVYTRARELQTTFAELLIRFGDHVGENATPRKGDGLKKEDRAREKAEAYKLVPVDLLAGKVAFTSLSALYSAAVQMENVFKVHAFRDRFRNPRASGYRDLQFVVDVEDHLAEIKLCHTAFDELDSYEHDLYKVRRALELKEPLTNIEELVLASLDETSTLMFHTVWEQVSNEGGEA